MILNPSIIKSQKPFIKPIYWLRSTQNISFNYYAYPFLYITYDLKPLKYEKNRNNELNDLIYFSISTIGVTFPSADLIKYRVVNKPISEILNLEWPCLELIDVGWDNAKIIYKDESNNPYQLNKYIIGINPEYKNEEKISLIISFNVNGVKNGNLLIYKTENPEIKEK